MIPIQHEASRIESKGNVIDASTLTVTLTEEQKVLRKIDRTVLPVRCPVFFLQYLHKQGLSYAGFFGGINWVQYAFSSMRLPTLRRSPVTTVRFLLGITEGCVSSEYVTITSFCYQKQDYAIRTAT
ncbi:uncharacterized protein PgNI_02447 [Pyricularia grisea]|uniref:Uncharacterized protein n=1 Tax=Pyricularia grisea TaxID=148305 RepID=A0A6P8BLL4_PYRGI|nr:uncharacterized protein PgNI_02447 [Pyricularia grisea]TLD17708.1 hypothetical protein PgNI_02447 [Pyricularia grisea]